MSITARGSAVLQVEFADDSSFHATPRSYSFPCSNELLEKRVSCLNAMLQARVLEASAGSGDAGAGVLIASDLEELLPYFVEESDDDADPVAIQAPDIVHIKGTIVRTEADFERLVRYLLSSACTRPERVAIQGPMSEAMFRYCTHTLFPGITPIAETQAQRSCRCTCRHQSLMQITSRTLVLEDRVEITLVTNDTTLAKMLEVVSRQHGGDN